MEEHIWSFSPKEAEIWGGFEGIARKLLILMEDPENDHSDVDEVYEEGGNLIIVFTDNSSEKYFANEVFV